MSPRFSRRTVIQTGIAGAALALAGCGSDIYVPEERPGEPDIGIENCRMEGITLRVTVTRVATDETVHDETHTVPPNYCGEERPSYYLEAVWTEPGEYAIRASGERLAPAERTTTVTERETETDAATRWVRVDESITIDG